MESVAVSASDAILQRAREGAFRDSVFLATYPAVPTNNQVPLAYERAGTYELTVDVGGFHRVISVEAIAGGAAPGRP